MKKLYKFNWDCGRMGWLDGLFIEDDEKVNSCIGKNVYFGEVLGKHSEISGELESTDLEVLSEDQDLIETLLKLSPRNSICGHNPISIIDDMELDEDDEDDTDQ